MKLEFLDIFSRKAKISSFIKIRLVGTEMFHADKETDRQRRTEMKLIVVFRNFANASKNS
jgi:hypothetical protein